MSFLRLIQIACGVTLVVLVLTSWSDAQNFESGLTSVGFTSVDLNSPLSNEKATVDVHGCKLGIDNTGTDDRRRTVAGHELPLYSVNSVAADDTWSVIPELAAKASSPDEVAVFLAARTQQYPCYTP